MIPVSLFRVGYVPKQQAEKDPQIVFRRGSVPSMTPFCHEGAEYRTLRTPKLEALPEQDWSRHLRDDEIRVPFAVYELPVSQREPDAELIHGARMAVAAAKHAEQLQAMGCKPHEKVEEIIVLFTPFLNIERGGETSRRALVGFAARMSSS